MYRIVSMESEAGPGHAAVREVAGDRRAPRRFTVTARTFDRLAAELDRVGRRPDHLRELLRLPDERDGRPTGGGRRAVGHRLGPERLRALRSACEGHVRALEAEWEREFGDLLARWDDDAEAGFSAEERRRLSAYETLRTLRDVADVALDAGVAVRIRG